MKKPDIQQSKDIENNSNQIVFSTGAGVSIASGITDF
ncbi:NAD-dependent protein deacylase, partial [Staphylococcus warneri]